MHPLGKRLPLGRADKNSQIPRRRPTQRAENSVRPWERSNPGVWQRLDLGILRRNAALIQGGLVCELPQEFCSLGHPQGEAELCCRALLGI